MFENTRHVSRLLDRFLSSLRHILQKHKVYLTDTWTSRTDRTALFAFETNQNGFNALGDDEVQFSQLRPEVQHTCVVLDPSFEEFWQSAAQSELNIDLSTWDDLFSALDLRLS